MTDSDPKVTTITVQFVYERETKNTVLYREYQPLGADAKIGALYVQKTTLADMDHPERLRVTLEVDDEQPFPRGEPKTTRRGSQK